MRNGVFEMFDPISAFEAGGLGAKTLLKKGFYRNFNNSFIGF